MTEMKLPVRILIALLCAVVILAMPFVLSGPNLLDHTKQQLMNEDSEDEEGEEIDFGRLFFSTAYAEDDLDVVSVNEGELVSQPDWALPQDDFTVPPMPNPAGYTENGYADETIQVMVESREIDGMTVHIANVKNQRSQPAADRHCGEKSEQRQNGGGCRDGQSKQHGDCHERRLLRPAARKEAV